MKCCKDQEEMNPCNELSRFVCFRYMKRCTIIPKPSYVDVEKALNDLRLEAELKQMCPNGSCSL
jgi:hypothetical protein